MPMLRLYSTTLGFAGGAARWRPSSSPPMMPSGRRAASTSRRKDVPIARRERQPNLRRMPAHQPAAAQFESEFHVVMGDCHLAPHLLGRWLRRCSFTFADYDGAAPPMQEARSINAPSGVDIQRPAISAIRSFRQ